MYTERIKKNIEIARGACASQLKYSNELKLKIGRDSLESGLSCEEYAKYIGIAERVLYRCRKLAIDEAAKSEDSPKLPSQEAADKSSTQNNQKFISYEISKSINQDLATNEELLVESNGMKIKLTSNAGNLADQFFRALSYCEGKKFDSIF